MKNIASVILLVLALLLVGFWLKREQNMNAALREQLAAYRADSTKYITRVDVYPGKVVLVYRDSTTAEEYVPPDGSVSVDLARYAAIRVQVERYRKTADSLNAEIAGVRRDLESAKDGPAAPGLKDQIKALERKLDEANAAAELLRRQLADRGQGTGDSGKDVVKVRDRGFCLKPGYGVCIYQTAEVDPKLYLQLAYFAVYNKARTRGAQYSFNLGGGLRAVDATVARTLSDLWRPLEHAELAAGAGVFYRGAVDGLGMKPNRRAGLALSLGIKGKF